MMDDFVALVAGSVVGLLVLFVVVLVAASAVRVVF